MEETEKFIKAQIHQGISEGRELKLSMTIKSQGHTYTKKNKITS